MDDDAFLAAFEAPSLTREDWTHEAHVRTAWCYAVREPDRDATARKLCQGIRNQNRWLKSDPKLYHETVTVAFAAIIHARATAPGAPDAWADFRDANRDLIDPGPSPLLNHYSQELLDSDAARLDFVNPDLAPLPG